MDVLDIVQSYLVDQSMHEYQEKTGAVKQIQFSDMHITNTEEGGSDPCKGITFQPYEVFQMNKEHRKRGSLRSSASAPAGASFDDRNIQVANKRSVGKDCLLRKISWQYTGGFDATNRPRIGYLYLEKLFNGKEIYIKGKQRATPDMNKRVYSVTGVYMITSFQMSDDILRYDPRFGCDDPIPFHHCVSN